MIEIPDFCYALDNRTINPLTKKGEVIKIVGLEKGFRRNPSGLTYEQLFLTQDEVDVLNLETINVDVATCRAMYDASVFGWEGYKGYLKRYIEFYYENSIQKGE